MGPRSVPVHPLKRDRLEGTAALPVVNGTL